MTQKSNKIFETEVYSKPHKKIYVTKKPMFTFLLTLGS